MIVVSEAKRNVMAQLELAYERHSVAEQVTRPTDPELASDYHDFAVRVLRARMAEEEDPKPSEPCGCIQCAAIYAAGS